ncbi:protein O-mannosyl-transferase TMTC2-like [Lutzomyia longipalpis]|uniref:protein O-mannosyl-transferase TMTC2-like n=1 Tax=Lutzomyia longipalpis TaxID=7200 RepID=UPI0024843792|nr:protein O-mannosyl-transferase TMTC2-like [Lutzomyia longipalpis]XP_055683481.1 protein O-mannosyl-transferase TMTC2-like [Lutzomyia longipalpis]
MAHCNKSSMDYVGLGCCALAVALYLNTLDAGFVYDDRRAILGNPDVLSSTPWRHMLDNDFWGTPLMDSGSHGSFRPLCVLSFRMNHLLSGFRPFGYHLTNVLLHAVATGLVLKLARHLLSPGWGATVAGVLFAAHPIHTEAVASIVGRADIAACIFYLICFLAYIQHVEWRERGDYRHWAALFGCFAAASLAILCKETAITALVLCAFYDILNAVAGNRDKNRMRSLVILSVVLASIVHLRLRLPTPMTQFSAADNPTAKVNSIWTRFLTFSYLPFFNFRLLLLPTTLSFDWGMEAIPRITNFLDPRAILACGFYTTLCHTLWRCTKTVACAASTPTAAATHRRKARTPRKKPAAAAGTPKTDCLCVVCKQTLTVRHSSSCRAINNNNIPVVPCACEPSSPAAPFAPPRPSFAILMAIALLVLPFLPATNLFFYVGFVVAERILYLPSVGACLLAGLAAGHVLDAPVHAAVATTVPRKRSAASRLRGQQRQRMTVTVFLCVVLSVFCFRTVIRNKDWHDEESLYRSAIDVIPPKALGNLGSVLSAQGRYAEAKAALQEALKHRPNMADVHYNLGVLLQNQQDFESAVESYQRAIHFRPSLAVAYLNLGTTLIALGRCQEAASVLREGSRLDGTGLRDRTAHENARIASLLQLGGLYADQGKLQRALAVYREALHTLPDSYPPQSIYHRLGDTLARLHQWTEAERFHRAALEAQPDHVAAHLSYGSMLARNTSRASEAEQWFKRALKLAPTDSSVYHHYAEFLNSMSRHEEACEMRIRAAELSPNDYSLVVTAATALRLLDRKAEAEKWYRQAVALRPDDARSHTNLGAILHLMGRTQQATASYREALRLQPGDPTTLGNLAKLGVVEVA